MNKFLFFLTLLTLPFTLLAEKSSRGIHGRVTDAMTKEPLAGVNVLLLDTEMGAATDLEGRFYLDDISSGTYRLEFVYIGYTTQKITDVVVTPGKPVMLQIELMETLLESETIKVTAGYFFEEQMTQPSVLGLSREEIRRFPGGFEDIVRTVSTLPGVAINTSGGRNDLLVRGGGPSENLFVINNIEIPNINHFGTQGNSSGSLSFVNLDFVDNVTFSTGGFPALYGDKMSSVLNLKMNRGRDDRLGGKLLISATQFGLNLEGPLGNRGDYIFSARQSYLDLIFKAAGLPFIPTYTDFNFIVNFQPSPKEEIFFLGLAALDFVDRDQSSLENRVTNAGILDNTQNQFITGINYRRLHENGYTDVTLNANLYELDFSQINEVEEEYFRSRAQEREFALKIQRGMAVGKQAFMIAGLSAKIISNTNNTAFADTVYDRSGNLVAATDLALPATISTDQNLKKYGAYLQFDLAPFERLSLNLGLRGDYYDFLQSSLYVSPRINLKYILESNFSLKGSLGIYRQPPSYVWLVNSQNRNLSALQNTMSVLGFDYLIREDLRMSLETYYKDYRDLPTGTVPGGNDYLVITNSGTSYGGREDDFQSFGYFDLVSGGTGNAYGIEWLLQKKYSEVPCYGQISVTYSKSEVKAGNGKTYPAQFDQRWIINLSGGYKFNSRWEMSTKFRYFTGSPYTPVYRPSQNPAGNNTIQNLPAEYLSARLVTQGVWDVRVDRYFSFDGWRLVVFLDIQNVTNNKFAVRPTYDFWEDKIKANSSIGILPSLGISAEF